MGRKGFVLGVILALLLPAIAWAGFQSDVLKATNKVQADTFVSLTNTDTVTIVQLKSAVDLKHAIGSDTGFEPTITAGSYGYWRYDKLFRNITSVDTTLSTGLLKVTTGTGALSSTADNSVAWDGAVTASHTRSHDITSTSDHTSTATPGYLLKANANGLAVNATNLDTEISSAVDLKHAAGHSLGSTSDHTDVDTTGLVVGQVLKFYHYDGTFATGGTETETGLYKIHTFTTSGALTVNAPGNVEVLVVAGGGGGGGGEYHGAGGGGGGVQYDASFVVTSQVYSVTVGGGGAGGIGGGAASNGSDSVFDTITATGGGAGANAYNVAGNGGCGGGASITGSAGTGSQGYDGGLGYGAPSYGRGGGGGAGGIGGDATDSAGGNGGAGYTSTISGSSVNYAGGGGGGCFNGTPGTGTDGGGDGGGYYSPPTQATSGTVNTGGGGGGGERDGPTGGAGGAGIVIIRYLKSLDSSWDKWIPGTIPTTAQIVLWDATGADSHIHNNKAVLDAIEESLTSAMKTLYDNTAADSHVHSNKAVLDSIEESLTSAMKTLYDNTAADSHPATKWGTKLIDETGVDTGKIPKYTTDGGGKWILVNESAGGGTGNVSTAGGTAGKLAKFSGSTTLVDSAVEDTGTTGNWQVGGDIIVDTPTLLTTGDKFGVRQNSPQKTVDIKLSDTAGADSVVIRNSSGTIIATIGSNGNITATGNPVINATDIYNVAWTDYFPSSTVTGWNTGTWPANSQKIYYKKIGKLVFVQFFITGDSTQTYARFTVPYNHFVPASYYPYVNVTLGTIVDNSVVQSLWVGHLELNVNDNIVYCYTNMSTGAWTNTGTKTVQGEFWYQTNE